MVEHDCLASLTGGGVCPALLGANLLGRLQIESTRTLGGEAGHQAQASGLKLDNGAAAAVPHRLFRATDTTPRRRWQIEEPNFEPADD